MTIPNRLNRPVNAPYLPPPSTYSYRACCTGWQHQQNRRRRCPPPFPPSTISPSTISPYMLPVGNANDDDDDDDTAAPGRTLGQMVEDGWRPTEAEVRRIAERVLEILVYLHGLRPTIVHRDLKPEVRRTFRGCSAKTVYVSL